MFKTTKSRLMTAALALLVCISMFVGSTFAWFTDSVSSVNNIIKSGNLDIEVEYTLDGNNWVELTADAPIFDANDLWEPGHTVVAALRIKNVGSLAAKLDVATNVVSEETSTNVFDEEFKLSDYLKVYTGDDVTAVDFTNREASMAALTEADFGVSLFDPATDVELLPNTADYKYCVIGITMPTTVGNEANHKTGVAAPKITFGITVNATQLMYEKDSFGDDYDEDATFATPVATAAAFADALANGGNLVLEGDIQLDAAVTIPAGKEVVLDLNGHTVTAAAGALWAVQNEGKLTVNGNGEIVGDNYAALYSNGELTVNGGTFTTPNGLGLIIDNIYGTEDSVAVINGGTFAGLGVYNPTDVTINGGTFNVGRDPDGASDHLSDQMTLFINPTFVGAPNNATVILNGGTFNGDIYVYDDGITETVFTNNGATITGAILDNN